MDYKGYEDLVLNDEELSELYQNNSLKNYNFLENEMDKLKMLAFLFLRADILGK